MYINVILQKLKGVKEGNGRYTALCPAHDDKNPSLAISEKDGKILVHCHAGCSKENIVSALGLEMKDLFVEEKPIYSHTNNNSKPKREIVAVYDYKDLDGNIVHSTIRYNPKNFSQRRPDPNSPGNFIYKEVFKGITPIIYNLPAVTKAIEEHRPIFIVEGEKDCETLAKLDFTATTCPMGAGKWRKEYSEWLKGATVYIVADNDDVGKSHAENVAKLLVGKASEIFLIDLKCGASDMPNGFDISDLLEATPEERKIAIIGELVANSTEYRGSNSENGNTGGSSGKISAAEQLLRFVETSGTTFFHSETKELYASIPVENHTEVQPIDSRDFELWLNGLFYRNIGKPISKDAVKQVVAALSAKALYDNPEPIKLSTRVAENDNVFWYDLSNANWQAVKIAKDGWEVVDNPPILFSRYRHQVQQTMPKNSGNINKILDYVNIKENKTLFLCWLVSCFVPNIPHTANIIHGEKGAAKSTASAMLKSLIDPSALETLTLQNNQRTLAVNLQSHWLLPFDNVSFINEEVSDTLCRAITGGGIQQRKLNTNSEDVIFTFQRCIIINGINNVATRADLLDRSILTELVRISDVERKELSEIMRCFEIDKVEILGGIFDTLVKAMNIYPTVKLENLPRMADFARWGYAIGEALDTGLGQIFLEEYQQNYERQNDEVLNNDPVATLTLEFMKDKTNWHGTHSALHDKFVGIAENCAINVKDKAFPRDAAALSKRLRNIMSNLRHEGIFYTPHKRQSYGVPLTLERRNEPTLLTSSHTNATQTAVNQGFKSVGNSVGSSVGTTNNNQPTLEPTSTETALNQGFDGTSVGNVGSVGENSPFGNGWVEVSDDEVPPEFLKPTLQEKLHEQIAL